MLDEKASVYGLKDKRNDEVFYVGMSTDPYARYGQHIAIRTAKNAKEDRILDMRKDGLMPELVIFEQDIPIEQAPEREIYWIHFHLERGITLTNVQHMNIKNELIIEPIHEDIQSDAPSLTDWQVTVWRIVYGDSSSKNLQKAKVTIGDLHNLFEINNLLDNIQGDVLREQLVFLRSMLLNTPNVHFIKKEQRFLYENNQGYFMYKARELMATVFP